jgi:hypothetical protein
MNLASRVFDVIIPWGNLMLKGVIFSCAVIYLMHSAKFTAVQAVYEAY